MQKYSTDEGGFSLGLERTISVRQRMNQARLAARVWQPQSQRNTKDPWSRTHTSGQRYGGNRLVRILMTIDFCVCMFVSSPVPYFQRVVHPSGVVQVKGSVFV